MTTGLEGRCPASTGWLIASILFANKLWIGDVTSMSLYWVARLPIKRPIRRTSHIWSMPAGRRRWRKIALSLAVVAALAGPFAFRTYEARPVYRAPLTAQEKEQFANAQEYCRQNDRNNEIALKRRNQMALLGLEEDPNSVVGMGDIVCSMGMGEFDPSGSYKYHFDLLEYFALNIGAAIVAFIGVYGLAFLIPMLVGGFAVLIRRYWKWLNA